MKLLILALIGLSCCAALAAAQPAAEPAAVELTRPVPADSPLPAALYELERDFLSPDRDPAELARRGARIGADLDGENRVTVAIVGPEGSPAVPEAALRGAGAASLASWRNRRDVRVPLDRLSELARSLPPGYEVRRARTWVSTESGGEGAAAMNVDGHVAAGADGSGIRVGIMDGGWDLLSESILTGDSPTSFTPVNWVGDTFQDPADGHHGTGCLEAVYDNAPGAEYYLYKMSTDTHIGLTVDHAIANGVDILSNSIAWLTSGWDDDSGIACAAANEAGLNGILFFTSSGNWAQIHYQGFYDPHDTFPNWHQFDGTGDRYIDIVVPEDGSLQIEMQWDVSGGTYNYDLWLFDAGWNAVAAGINPGNDYEFFLWDNLAGADQTVHLGVVRESGGITEFEIFAIGGQWQDHIVSAGSSSSPANSTNPNVVTVGAVWWTNYPSGTIESYSSRGPSNSGMGLPDIVGPTGTSGAAYPGGMGGTSNSTPNCAGAAAAFWSADTLLHPSAVRELVYAQAAAYLDWGDAGFDQTFGWGGMYLHDFAPHTLWVWRGFNNLINHRAYPFYTVSAAQAAATAGGRLVVLGGSYPEPVVLDKDLRYEALAGTATLGR